MKKYSKQRELILQTLKHSTEHPSAERLYEQVKKEIPSLALGTVYRNVRLLKEEGLVVEIYGTDGKWHYDYNTEKHHHFLCEECGRISDLTLTSPEKSVETLLVNLMGGDITLTSIKLKGLCSECKKRAEKGK